DLLAQRAEAQAAVADAEATLEKLRAGSLPTDIERARGQLVAAEAALAQAQKIYERRRALYEQGAIPGRELLVSETELKQAQANYEVAKTSLELLKQETRERDIRIAESRLAQARARLAYVETQLEYTRLRAPFSGVVTEQYMFAGDMARPDAPVFLVAELAVAVARAQVPEAEAGPVRTGQPCRFQPVDEPERQYGGCVSVVNRAVDPERRTVEAWCEIPNPERKLRAGMFGDVTIITGVIPQAVTVPLNAVEFVEGASRGMVRVVGRERTVETREVETRMRSAGKVQVVKGVKEGELVIVEGGYGLAEGVQVRFEEAKR
ncbi:MAG: efflux RND transporter periplasmic adaptor subunit, partial [Bryobacteraceae bacterium]